MIQVREGCQGYQAQQDHICSLNSKGDSSQWESLLGISFH